MSSSSTSAPAAEAASRATCSAESLAYGVRSDPPSPTIRGFNVAGQYEFKLT